MRLAAYSRENRNCQLLGNEVFTESSCYGKASQQQHDGLHRKGQGQASHAVSLGCNDFEHKHQAVHASKSIHMKHAIGVMPHCTLSLGLASLCNHGRLYKLNTVSVLTSHTRPCLQIDASLHE